MAEPVAAPGRGVSPMRIAEINDIASVATEIGAGLRARGHTVDYFYPRLVGAKLPPNIKPVTGPIRALDWLDLIRRIRAGRYDLVHIHYAYLGNIGALGGFPYILHCHGTDLRGGTPVTRPLIANAVRAARHVFYSTPDLAAWVLPLRPDAEFLPNPIDTSLFAPRTPASAHRAAWVACALTKVKGAERILRACRLLAERVPDLRIDAFGGGEYTEAFRALPNVTLYARHPRARLPQIIDEHGIVIGQARLGSAGMAELEAMACGRPVVTWFNERGGYSEPPPFFSAVDGDDIARIVERLANDPAVRDRAGAAGRAWVERHHGLGRIVDRVEAVAQAIIRGEPVPAAPAA
ncbi:glycosyltransferase family 4 protein [Tepidiforma sp.]|uniref:glycosyltransferase family 4 protein n=1 Tax=Tepidiforma sp. TaxID=2682230 RepID=UPI002608F351|nr:glycosyltransferase family 4 protein [Tepidiforma sp.]MCX7618001.1 glycosyltransferase family 4 protein [Tepidiforma sp.]